MDASARGAVSGFDTHVVTSLYLASDELVRMTRTLKSLSTRLYGHIIRASFPK